MTKLCKCCRHQLSTEKPKFNTEVKLTTGLDEATQTKTDKITSKKRKTTLLNS